MNGIKRNTKINLEIEIEFPLENVEKIEFIFKREKKSHASTILHFSVNKEDIEVLGGDTTDGFTVLLPLEEEDTSKLSSDGVYMDTKIYTADGYNPLTEIEYVNIFETLFGEVSSNE